MSEQTIAEQFEASCMNHKEQSFDRQFWSIFEWSSWVYVTSQGLRVSSNRGVTGLGCGPDIWGR